MNQLKSGCRIPLEEWMGLNRVQIFTNPELKRYVSPFPPIELMANVSGLQNEQDFAAHGTDIYRALTAASSKPFSEFSSILDFGCGCGRLARMFKGHSGRIAGCDIDARHVDWINNNLAFMEAKLSKVTPPIPYEDNEFEAIISISIFTHLTEKSQDQFLSELYRVCSPVGRLFLTVHGKRALERALNEPTIRAMLAMDEQRFERAQLEFAENRHAFVLQFGHLTTVLENASDIERAKDTVSDSKKMVEEPFEYGITFVPEDYVRSHWGKWFDIVDYHHGGIHNFQDIVVLKPKK
ncbi:class I SAM-dependent methyltransferase [Methyloglobulus sp.]|uniref:class I SAM-dependent methyltransferase n=1 Tax=Methyloglobulus sp. TaxID=2518622 RepID=UPI003988D4FE